MLARLTTSVRARWALVIFFMVTLAAIRAAAPEERDPYWSARAGLDTLAGLPLARPDTWSWSQPGGTWYQNSPLWNVFLGLSWQAGGFWGLFCITFVSIGVLLGMGWLLAVKLGVRPLPGLIGVMLAVFVAFPMLSARATVVVQTLLLVAVWAGDRFLPKMSSLPLPLSLPAVGVAGFLLSTFGNWVHLSFVMMAPAIAVMWAVQLTTIPAMPWMRRAVVAAAGAAGLAGGVLTTPYGLAETLRQSAKTQAECAGLIGEWATVWQTSPVWIVRALVVLTVAGAAAWSLLCTFRAGRWQTGTTRIVAPLSVIGIPLALGGVFSIRFLGVALLAMLPVAAWESDRWVERVRRAAASGRSRFWSLAESRGYLAGATWVVVLSLAAVMFVPFAGFYTARGATPPEMTLIRQLPPGCQLYAPDPAVSGPVILTRHDVKVWMDGRADFYGRRQLISNYRILAGLEPVPAGATCVILNTMYGIGSGFEARMDADLGWRRAGEVGDYIMWLADGGNLR